MPTIMLTDEVYASLEALAVGFDTPNSVIKRLLDKELGMNKPQEYKGTESIIPIPKGKITLEIIETLYPIAKEVYEGRREINDAVGYLEGKMSRASAFMYIKTFSAIRQGECYTRTINKIATRYFLERIFEEYNIKELKMALDSVRSHIMYFEQFLDGRQMKPTREIYTEFLKIYDNKLKEQSQ